MSEHAPGEQDAFWQYCEQQFCDPSIDGVYEEARALQVILDEMLATDEDVQAVLEILNDQWPYMGKEISLRGLCRMFCDNDVYENRGEFRVSEEEILERSFEGLPVVSRGFMVIYQVVKVDGESCFNKPVIVHHGLLEANDGAEVDVYASIDGPSPELIQI